eukprot:gnl/Spiro4/2542_TR1226_c0_g1_i1.p1 gnl/Spiro4/2542_TR1226_c0_g1~~gnl/Spiro4/2542_TR1226_c0_g1_i1.p1  ORF type:complete len:399 (-),score=105.92 gnl/Spiro4/2542_TR1226_c0_g1_i1:260-1369(-)
MRSATVVGAVSMVVLAIQFGVQPFLARRYIPRELPRVAVVVWIEVTKVVLAGGLLALQPAVLLAELRRFSLSESLAYSLPPALVFSLQNICIQISLANVEMLTWNLINQSKLLFTAFFLWLFLGLSQTKLQQFALVLMAAAAVILTLDDSGSNSTVQTSFMLGLAPCFAAAILSGLSSTLSQFSMQKLERHPFLFTIELSFYSCVTLLCSELGVQLYRGLDSIAAASGPGPGSVGVEAASGGGGSSYGSFEGVGEQFWQTFTVPATLFIPAISQAIGGIAIGLIVKHLGSLHKCFALIAGVVITGVVRLVITGAPLTVSLTAGAVLVCFSTWLHTVASASPSSPPTPSPPRPPVSPVSSHCDEGKARVS